MRPPLHCEQLFGAQATKQSLAIGTASGRRETRGARSRTVRRMTTGGEVGITRAWKLFEGRLRAGISAKQMGFVTSDGDVSRFLARYRLAAAFERASFRGYPAPTSRAYSSLLRLFLAWSAFEQLALAIGLKTGGDLHHGDIDEFFERHRPPLARMTSPEITLPLRQVLAKHLTSAKLINNVTTSPSPRSMCLAFRNAFVHGPLTVHAGSRKPKVLAQAADDWADWLLKVAADEFSTRVGP